MLHRSNTPILKYVFLCLVAREEHTWSMNSAAARHVAANCAMQNIPATIKRLSQVCGLALSIQAATAFSAMALFADFITFFMAWHSI